MEAELAARLRALHEWVAPSHGLKLETIDAHAGGQPLRLIVGGLPLLRGRNMMERCAYAREHFDHLRSALMCEPRGHPDMVGCLLTPSQRGDAHCGALFVHRGGFSPMCGHGVIALTTILLEAGVVDMRAPETRLKIDTPAGMVRAYGVVEDDRVRRVFFENVPSFAVRCGAEVQVPGLGRRVRCDVAYAGAWFVFVEASELGLACTPAETPRLVAAAAAVREAVTPLIPELGAPWGIGGLFGVVFGDRAMVRRGGASADLRQVCVFGDGCVNRSPSAMALSARLAVMAARGEAAQGTALVVEGLLGTTFGGRIVAQTSEAGLPAVIVEVDGAAWITGRHTFFIDPLDPCLGGFLL